MTEAKTERNWLEDALTLDVCVGTEFKAFNELRDELFDEISFIKRFYRPRRVKETIKTILSNLYIAHFAGRPLRYSRSPNHYSSTRRYGKLHFKHSKVVGVMDAMEELGYLRQHKGYLNRKDHVGRQTRVFATEKLLRLFRYIPEDLIEFYPIPPKEIIQLRDSRGVNVDYLDNEETIRMRKALRRYNEFIKDQTVTINVPGDLPVKLVFLKSLKLTFKKGWLKPILLKLAIPNSPDSIETSKASCKPYHSHNCNYDTYAIRHLDIETHSHVLTQHCINTITNKILENLDSCRHGNEFETLLRFGVLNLECDLKCLSLHRVFNRESFELGGRFYGSYHLKLPKQIRKNCLLVNGSPTVEPDYSALHIRMLYHLEGIDYREDPYLAVCKREEERELFKSLQLIAINAENEKSMIMGFRHKHYKKGIRPGLTDKNILSLLDRFKEGHPSIAHFLNSGIGRTLQNIDSRVTENIIMDLMNEGIPVLPVHDSYIVEEKHEDKLVEKMVEHYERTMGFEPVIG